MSHPIHAKDADVGCRWLCLMAGQRTREDEIEVAKALQALPFPNGAFPHHGLLMNPARVWELVK